MKGQAVSFIYVLNIVLQSLFSLLFSTAAFVGIAYLLGSGLGVGEWVYIPMILVGLFVGIFSMLKFIMSAMAGLERLEQQREDRNNKEV